MLNRIKGIIMSLKSDPLKRSMLLSTLCKPLGMIISFFYTPVLLGYLGEESYGIWSTILSVINWINYFDIGIGQGLRNSLAKYISAGQEKEANEAVSTGYVALSTISGITFILGSLAIMLLNMGVVFNTSLNIRPALMISFSCICMNFVLGLSRAQLYATQQAEKVSFMTVLTQLINLLGIIIISQISHGSILAVAIVIGLSGIIVNALFSKGLWTKHRYLIPKLSNYRKSELKEVCSIGIKFFFIQIAALVLYSTDNMIITQLFGPSYVTPYHTSYTAFGIVNGLFAAMMSPLWSKYTVAMEHNDYAWIKRTVFSFDKMLPLIAAILIIGVFAFEPVSRIWLRRSLDYESGLIPCMALYFFLQIWGSIYATVLNGIGHVNLQLVLAVVTAVLNIPLSIFLGQNCGMGSTGVLLATVVCMAITDIPVTIYTHKYLDSHLTETKQG